MFAGSSDPVAGGVVTNLARPERNLTGVSLAIDARFAGKWLDLLGNIAPAVSRVAALWSSANPAAARFIDELRASARVVGATIDAHHAADARVYVGLIVALSYRNPHLDPFAEFQRWKQHPAIRAVLAGGQRISYGARAVNKGGLQSLPRLSFPGGLLVGCDAGLLNPAKIKGSHAALKSGMLAAETIFAALAQEGPAADAELREYDARVRVSWLGDELRRGVSS